MIRWSRFQPQKPDKFDGSAHHREPQIRLRPGRRGNFPDRPWGNRWRGAIDQKLEEGASRPPRRSTKFSVFNLRLQRNVESASLADRSRARDSDRGEHGRHCCATGFLALRPASSLVDDQCRAN